MEYAITFVLIEMIDISVGNSDQCEQTINNIRISIFSIFSVFPYLVATEVSI